MSTAAKRDFFALQGHSYHNSSTNSSTKAFLEDNEIGKSLEINDAGVAELADAPDLGSGGEIRRGSSPLPGSFPRIKCLFTKLLDHLKRLAEFSLQRQDLCAAQRGLAIGGINFQKA